MLKATPVLSPPNNSDSDKSKLNSALCIVVETKGSSPRKVGARMTVWENGKIEGTIGGGNLEKKVIENAIVRIKEGSPKLYKHDLLHQHNMCCGGTVMIYIEPIMERKNLYIFGAGHTGVALASLAKNLDFEIYIIDDRPEYINQIEIKGVHKLDLGYQKVLPSLPFNKNTYVVIMTYEHAHDRDILSYCINQPSAYLGMIGSQRKIELTKKMFKDGKLATEQQLNNVDMPLGLKINAEGPDEIAVSILAKIIQVKNEK